MSGPNLSRSQRTARDGPVGSRCRELTSRRERPSVALRSSSPHRPCCSTSATSDAPHVRKVRAHGSCPQQSKWTGPDYEILTISIDPREKPEGKARKDGSCRAQGGGHRLALRGRRRFGDQVTHRGVGFANSGRSTTTFDHPPALIFLSPQGEVTRVLQGTTFSPRDVRLALVEASNGKAGTFFDELQLSCLTFDPVSRTWSLKAMTVMKIGGVLTVIGLLVMIGVMLRRERRRAPAAPSPT